MLVALLLIATCAVLVAVNFQEDPDAALEKLKKVQVSSLCISIAMVTRVIVCVFVCVWWGWGGVTSLL